MRLRKKIIVSLIIFFFQGCLTKFETFVKDNVFIIGGVGIGLAFVQVKMI